MYQTTFTAHCGLSYDVGDPTDDLKEARKELATFIRRKREHGHAITRLRFKRDGRTPRDFPTFEIETESNRAGVFVTDDDGLLFVKHETFECRECGQEHETKEAQAYCCSEQEREDMYLEEQGEE